MSDIRYGKSFLESNQKALDELKEMMGENAYIIAIENAPEMYSDLEKDRERLGHHLVGTCESLDSAIEYLELDENIDWEDELLTISVETCQGCGWWMNSWDLEEDHVGNFLCDQCHEDEDA